MSLPASDPLINGTDVTLAAYSANWTASSFGTGVLHVNNGGCYDNNNSSSAGAFWNADSFPPDQYSQITLVSLTDPGAFGGPAVRMSNGSGGSWYHFAVRNDGVNYDIEKLVNGTFTNITGQITNTFNAGDVLKITVVGLVISVYQNGTLLNSVTDSGSTLSGGSAGFDVFRGGGATSAFNTWSGGATSSGTDTLLGQGWV